MKTTITTSGSWYVRFWKWLKNLFSTAGEKLSSFKILANLRIKIGKFLEIILSIDVDHNQKQKKLTSPEDNKNRQ